MDLIWKWILFIAVVMFGVFVQAAAGFGGTLISMPLGILLLGVEMTKPVMTIAAFLAGVVVLIADYKYINWKELLKMAGVMLLGVIFGLWVFQNLSLPYLLIAYAVIIMLIGLKRLFLPGTRKTPRFLRELALAGAGIMQGLFVSGGSFLVVYAVERIPEKREFRATVNAVWAILNIFLIASYWQGGMLTKDVLVMSAAAVLPCLLTIWIAGLTAKRLKQKTFLRIIYIILVASGAVLLISNL